MEPLLTELVSTGRIHLTLTCIPKKWWWHHWPCLSLVSNRQTQEATAFHSPRPHSKFPFHLSSEITSRAQDFEVYHAILLLYIVTFLSTGTLVSTVHHWLTFCLRWLYGTSSRHTCSHVYLWTPTLSWAERPSALARLHSHSTHFINPTQHPYSRSPYILHTQNIDHCVCENMHSNSRSLTWRAELKQPFLKSLLFKISFIDP